MNPLDARHGDVLHAVPDSDASREALVEELKRRGNVAFGAKSFAEAEVLYSKAIEHDAGVKELWGNRSAARCGMGKIDDALADASEAVRLDPRWAKGQFRRGQALQKGKRLAEAVAAFEAALDLSPDDAKLRTQLARARKLAAEAPADAARAQAKRSVPPLEERASPPAKAAKRAAAAAAGAKSAKKGGSADSDDEDEDDDEGAGAKVRGYRVLEDGRKTTFFHHEQTEEEKALIGDIAPKKIDAAAAPAAAITAPSGASAWNSLGTYEERNLTPWARARLAELLVPLRFPLPGGAGQAQTTAFRDMEGDCNKCVIRGSLRYLLLVSFVLDWEVSFEEDGQTVRGELRFEDASTESAEDGLDAQIVVTGQTTPQRRELIEQHVKRAGLFDQITARFGDFLGEFTSS